MALLQLAQVGCGGMGLRHVYGLAELRRCGFDTFGLAALCDRHRSSAEHVAGVAEAELGLRPRIYTDLQAMLEAERGLDAVNIVTDTRMHHVFALDAFDAGLHVAVEKPMGITVRACLRMIEAGRASGRVLSVSENYRRDPMNRLTKALLRGGVIGEPRLAINVATSGGRGVRQVVAWRHMKERGGLILEYGVHTSDLTLYLMGGVERVFAETHLWEKTRTMAETAQPMQGFYDHRVKEDAEKSETIEATAEDTGLALVRFASGAIGQTTYSDAAPGEPSDTDIIYGSEGSLRLPGSRSGCPIQVTLTGGRSPCEPGRLARTGARFQARRDDCEDVRREGQNLVIRRCVRAAGPKAHSHRATGLRRRHNDQPQTGGDGRGRARRRGALLLHPRVGPPHSAGQLRRRSQRPRQRIPAGDQRGRGHVVRHRPSLVPLEAVSRYPGRTYRGEC